MATTAKRAALLAGGRGLDGGVQRQQVGLLGDVGDGGDDLADRLGLFAEGDDVFRDGLGLLLNRIHDPGAVLRGVEALVVAVEVASAAAATCRDRSAIWFPTG